VAAVDVVGRFFKKIFGSRNERLLRRYLGVADEIASLEAEIRGDYDEQFAARVPAVDDAGLSDEDREARLQQIRVELSRPLAAKTAELRRRLSRPMTLDKLVPPDYSAAEVEDWMQRVRNGEPLASVLPEGLRDQAEAFRQAMADAEEVAEYLPLAFALVREASRRAQEHRHFPCQLVGGQVLFQGNVAEMRTGEGKTIVCHLAAFVKVLQGQKVHIVTVNDYLVQRDAEFARPIFELLGVSVGYIQSNVDPGGHEGVRQKAYACDITYGTNNEFGFDYLRDNMKMRASDQVQGPLNYTIVDEVDSILIDEARTPLIISGPARGNPADYRAADDYAKQLEDEQKRVNNEMRARLAELEKNGIPDEIRKHPKFEDAFKRFKVDPYMLIEEEAEAIGHTQYFVVQRDRKQVHVTHEGVELAAKRSGLGSFYLEENMNWPHLIENALRARIVYERDKDYVVQDREVIIVDEFTGRLMHGRQWSDGLHQAVEAKHRNEAEIKRETQTLATVTLQNYFKLYDALAGMTGTAMTESDEFMKIYRLEVIEIPTNRPVNRNEHNDKIYRSIEHKYNAIVDEIHHVHRHGRPNDPFLLANVFDSLKPICQQHAPEALPKLEEALRRFNEASEDDAKVIGFMCEVYDEVMQRLATGRPILVGTTSVENSEKIRAALLRRYAHDFPPKAAKSKEVEGLEVLNAKYHAREAEIVAKAGWRYEAPTGKQALGNVTIATNMAGRGTDIKLEKDVVYEKCKGELATQPDDPLAARRAWQERNPDGSPKVGTKCCIHCPDYDGVCDHCWKPKLDPRFPELGRKVCPLNSPCGLHIVGTERHEARRIDNQLRGRSGRQGDPGSSRFFLSLEDDLLKLFMPDWMLKMMEKLGFTEGASLEDRRISKGIERAQKKVEERNFSTRKHLLEWDEPMDYQRKAFYRERQQVLTSRAATRLVRRMFADAIADAAENFLGEDYRARCVVNWCREQFRLDLSPGRLSGLEPEEIQRFIREAILDKSRDDVTNVLGEYIDRDLPPEEWDVKGLSRFASGLGVSTTENQLRRMDPIEIEDMLLAATETYADGVDLSQVEAYADPNRGLNDFAAWAARRFSVGVNTEDWRDQSADAIQRALLRVVEDSYEKRRAVFPIEWIIEEAYARRAGSGSETRWGHELVAGWANAKFGGGWSAERLQKECGGDIQGIGDALLSYQRRCLEENGTADNPLADQIDKVLDEYAARPFALRQWATNRFKDAFDDNEFEALVGELGDGGEFRGAAREMLLEAGRHWLCWEFNRFECSLLLRSYDEAWMDHLLEMDHLKYAIMQRPLGGDQTHPQSQYAIEGREYFQKMWGRARDLVLDRILRVRPSGDPSGRSIYQATETRHDASVGTGFAGARAAAAAEAQQAGLQAQGEVRVTETIRRTKPKVKPNEPCPCGSGKKYKKCCGRPGVRT
jgi:preprotein translocase subunit SecA